jgi:hypothetical protein
VYVDPQSLFGFWTKAPKHFEELTVNYMHPSKSCGTYLLTVSSKQRG